MTKACISSIAAAIMAAEKILAGSAKATLVGGCETFSDVPIRFRCAAMLLLCFNVWCNCCAATTTMRCITQL